MTPQRPAQKSETSESNESLATEPDRGEQSPIIETSDTTAPASDTEERAPREQGLYEYEDDEYEPRVRRRYRPRERGLYEYEDDEYEPSVRRRYRDPWVGTRFVDEIASLRRAVMAGYLAEVQALSEITGSVADDVLSRDRGRGFGGRRGYRPIPQDDFEEFDEPRPRTRSMTANGPREDLPREARERRRRRGTRTVSMRRGYDDLGPIDEWHEMMEDLYDGIIDGIEDAVEVPRRALDEFYETYRRSRPRGRR